MGRLKIAAIDIAGNVVAEDKVKPQITDFTIKCGEDPNTTISGWWYLHGDLEEEVGYDKGAFVNLKKDMVKIKNCYFNGNEKYFDVVCLKDGIYDVEVIGFDEPCVGYFWINDYHGIPECRGLVCFKDDEPAVEYAEKMYNEKAWTL